jgi:hypothetical protein
LPTFFEECRYEYRHGSLEGYATAPRSGQRFTEHLGALLGAELAQTLAQLRPAVGEDGNRQQRGIREPPRNPSATHRPGA